MLEPEGLTIPHWIVRRTDLSGGAKILYSVLLRGVGGRVPSLATGPSVILLCTETGFSTRKVRKYLRELHDGGFIKLRCEPSDNETDIDLMPREDFE